MQISDFLKQTELWLSKSTLFGLWIKSSKTQIEIIDMFLMKRPIGDATQTQDSTPSEWR